MRAISLKQSELTYQASIAEPIPNVGEVLVDISLAGICETDLQLCKGYMSFSGILGHEFVGVARSGKYAGQRVVGEINCICSRCEWCLKDAGNHCPSRSVIGILGRDGAFADVLAIPEMNLHPVPDTVSDEQAVFVEPLAAALQVGRQVDLEKCSVAVLGDGRLGMLSAQATRLTADAVLVVGKHVEKLTRFERLGIPTVLLGALPQGASFDVVIDCTGSSSGLSLATQLVKPSGTIVMKTTVAGNHDVSLASIVINEINLVGSRCGPFDQALSVLDSDSVDLTGLISHRFSLAEIDDAMRAAVSPEAFKVILDMGM